MKYLLILLVSTTITAQIEAWNSPTLTISGTNYTVLDDMIGQVNNLFTRNHDAFRTGRLRTTVSEPCGDGSVISRLKYHNGDEATPDIGDKIYTDHRLYTEEQYLWNVTGWFEAWINVGNDLESGSFRIENGIITDRILCSSVPNNTTLLNVSLLPDNFHDLTDFSVTYYSACTTNQPEFNYDIQIFFTGDITQRFAHGDIYWRDPTQQPSSGQVQYKVEGSERIISARYYGHVNTFFSYNAYNDLCD